MVLNDLGGAEVLREARETDVETIREWRNHPKTRGASIWTAYITPEGHARWWAKVQADPARRVLIFSYAGRDCGVVTFNDHDPVAGSAEWGFFLDVDGLQERGELLPAWLELERSAVHYAFGEMGLRSVGGRTLAWNTPVIALHRRFGFVEVPSRRYTTEIDGTEQPVVWTEKTRTT
ncbi:GNAT family N-acetyltransferase [Dactylosporangium sp. NPDC051485]|uniref:GNAT family N-acetyltransferase n=1 Tax=Dactylosporangium sp. NPDC051485 TaxID=3154846 RepID=UPI0034317DB9